MILIVAREPSARSNVIRGNEPLGRNYRIEAGVSILTTRRGRLGDPTLPASAAGDPHQPAGDVGGSALITENKVDARIREDAEIIDAVPATPRAA